MISPDAHWMAYVSNESGKDEVYVQPFPGPGGKWQISTGGGVTPMWAKNGRELFYQSDDKLMAVDITTQPAFTAGSPKVLFEGRGRYQWSTARPDYDVSADGQRFLMKKSGAAEVTTSQINIVQNWFEELRRRVPVQ
jgi:Tol biopolymer transport system component